jgi:hypothetical protein
MDRSAAYRDAIRRRVCSPCLDGRGDGTCGLSGRACALDVHLPRVVEAILAVDSHRMDDFIAAIEAEICADCESPGSGGTCRLREQGDCALSTYLPLVVDAVGEVRQSLTDTPIRSN